MFDAGSFKGLWEATEAGTNNPTWEGRVTSVLLGDGIGMWSQGRAPSWQRKGPEAWRHRHSFGVKGRQEIRLERWARARLWNRDHRSAFERDLPGDYRGRSGVVRSRKSAETKDVRPSFRNNKLQLQKSAALLAAPLPAPRPWSSFLKITPRGGKSL